MSIIDEIMKSEGEIKLTHSQFSKIISDYYQRQYNIKGIFDFICITYNYIPDNSLNTNTLFLNKTTVYASMPCLINKNSHEYFKSRNIVIPGIVNLDELDEEIKKVLPPEIIRVPNEEISLIFNELGLSKPLYKWMYDDKTNALDYNVTVRKINVNNKIKVLEY